MTFRLLLVEDDVKMREIITDYFTEKSGGTFVMDSAETGEKVRQKCLDDEYDLVFLDVMLLEQETPFFTLMYSEVAVFTSDYELLFNTNNYWRCSYTKYKDGNTH